MSTVTDALTTADRWAILVGFGLPLLIAIVNRSHWPAALKAVVSFVAVLIAAAVTVVVEGNFNTHDWIGSIVLVGFVAYTSYRLFWKPSTIAPQIEAATTPGARPVPPAA